MEYLSLYSRDCLSCGHLVDHIKEPTRPKTCHHSKGNKSCPAQEIHIVITGKLKALVNDLIQARILRDAGKEAEVMRQVAAETEVAQKTFYKLLETRTTKK